jgi:hypothetical protein
MVVGLKLREMKKMMKIKFSLTFRIMNHRFHLMLLDSLLILQQKVLIKTVAVIVMLIEKILTK